MKRGVVIVNTSRGAVIDEGALVAALQSGHGLSPLGLDSNLIQVADGFLVLAVRSVALDVFEQEPKVHEGLVASPNAVRISLSHSLLSSSSRIKSAAHLDSPHRPSCRTPPSSSTP